MQKILDKSFRKYCKGYNAQFAVVESTNSAVKSFPYIYKDKDVLVSPHQAKGRGRGEKSFLSEDGGAYFSIVYKKKTITSKEALRYVLIAGLGVKKTLEEMGVRNIFLKWPNDVLVNEKKICGILCESTVNEKGNAEVIIIGIGVNVNNEIKLPQMIRLSDLVVAPSIDKIIAKIVKNIDFFASYDFDNILIEYKESCCTIGKRVKYFDKEGIAEDITEEGYLIVRTGFEEIIVKAGEVFIKE